MCWSNSGTRFERSPGRLMRVIISAPRKSGGAQLRCLLSMAYDLKAPPASAPAGAGVAATAEWVAGLPDRSVSTCDLPFPTLEAAAAQSGVHIVGIIRHPFDLFLSNFDVAQQRAARGREDEGAGFAWSILSGEELESDVTQSYAASGFASEVSALLDWHVAGGAVRYEDILVAPESVLRALSPALGPLSPDEIVHAAALCPAENVVASRPGRGRRMPSLPPGAWRERLPPPLLATLRTVYGAEVARLGYDAS